MTLPDFRLIRLLPLAAWFLLPVRSTRLKVPVKAPILRSGASTNRKFAP